MSYLAVKHLHITFATLSILFFAVRAFWAVAGSARLSSPFVRIVPHIVDTLLLVCGIALAVMMGAGAMQPWLLAKIVALLLYIGLGTYAIKRGRTPRARALAALAAILVFVYIVGVALTKQPMSWLA